MKRLVLLFVSLLAVSSVASECTLEGKITEINEKNTDELIAKFVESVDQGYDFEIRLQANSEIAEDVKKANKMKQSVCIEVTEILDAEDKNDRTLMTIAPMELSLIKKN